jgi:hypothetical protein
VSFCLSVGFRNSGEIIKASGSFFKRGGRSKFILYCARMILDFGSERPRLWESLA